MGYGEWLTKHSPTGEPMGSSFWHVEIDRISPLEWARLLNLFDDANLYQTFSYGYIRWGAENLSHIVLKKGHDVVAIAQLRILQPTKLKLGIAYVRWGPLWVRTGITDNWEAISRIVQAMEEEYVHNRGLVLRIIPNTFLGSTRGQIMAEALKRFQVEAVLPGDQKKTLVLDLSPTLQSLRGQFHRKWRNQLTAAEKRGLMVTSGTTVEEFRIFGALYREMRCAKRFDSFVDVEEFTLIQAALPEAHRMWVFLCFEDQTPLGGLVVSTMGNTAIYVLGATVSHGRRTKASYLLQWSLIQWLKERQILWYDLGGIDPDKDPGVYHFKRGLSGEVKHFMGPYTLSIGAMSKVISTGLAAYLALR